MSLSILKDAMVRVQDKNDLYGIGNEYENDLATRLFNDLIKEYCELLDRRNQIKDDIADQRGWNDAPIE